jgi:hypothetical protein
MAQRVRIQCITRPGGRTDPHRHITHVGGQNPNGSPWKLTEEAAIQGIKDGKWDFYTLEGGMVAEVIYETGPSGREFLKTVPDGQRPDNLLSLPPCP